MFAANSEIFQFPRDFFFFVTSFQQMICSKGQELRGEHARLLKKLPLHSHGAVCTLASTRHKRADKLLPSVRVWRVFAEMWRVHAHTRTHVSLGSWAQTAFFVQSRGTISALCGRTAAPLLKSQASNTPFVLLADNTAALAPNMLRQSK